jgi:hypothetical protein
MRWMVLTLLGILLIGGQAFASQGGLSPGLYTGPVWMLLQYDTGPHYHSNFGPGDQVAVLFTPGDPCTLFATEIWFRRPGTCTLHVWDDSGGVPNGSLYETVLTTEVRQDWDSIPIPPIAFQEDDSFHIGLVWGDDAPDPPVGMDNGLDTTGHSHVDTAGVWEDWVYDICIRAWVVVQDLYPPEIWDLQPEEGSTTGPRPIISARYEDTMSGVDTSTVVLMLDSVTVIPDTLTDSCVVYQPDTDLSAGTHYVDLIVGDKAANMDTVSWYFDVLGIAEGEEMHDAGLWGLRAIYPNPTSRTSEVVYSLGSPSSVRLSIYDLTGRKVATLVEGGGDPGVHRVRWESPASGIFFCRLETDGGTFTGKLMVIR